MSGMGLPGSYINNETIIGIVEGNNFNMFVDHLRANLGIVGTREHYPINVKDYHRVDGGFVEQNTFGTLYCTPMYREIIEIGIYADSIVERINDVFSHRINNQHVMNIIAEIYVLNTVAHEYVHVWQHEEQRLTGEIMEVQNRLNYAERGIEIEAARLTPELLIQYTCLESTRLNQVFGMYIDNDDAAELSEFLTEWERRNN